MTAEAPAALLITPVLPYHTGSGRALRAWGWLIELARTHRVHVIVTSEAQTPEIPVDYPAAAVHHITSDVHPGHPWPQRIGLVAPFLAAGSRRFVTDWQWLDADKAEALSASLPAAVDRIVVFRLYLHDVAQSLARAYPSASVAIDVDDLESTTRASMALALLRMRRHYEAVRTLSGAIQYALVERTLGRRYARAYLAAPEDCGRMSSNVAMEIVCRPNRIALPADTPLPDRRGPLRLLFTGTLNYPPNEEAVLWLVRHCVPLISQQLSSAVELTIVGRHAAPPLRAAVEGRAGVTLISDAADIDDWYHRSDVVLAPLFAGGGTKLKAIECFAYRRPLVSSAHGVRGLGVQNGLHYINAETPAAFAAAVVRLAKDPQLARRIADAGWKHCVERFQLL